MTDEVKELLKRTVQSLQLADNLGDVRDTEKIYLYPALRRLGLDPHEMRYPSKGEW